MSPTATEGQDSQDLGWRLVRLYSRWTLLYLAGVIALWVLGIEGIYENATPFYALVSSAASTAWVPVAVMALFAAVGLAIAGVRRALRRSLAALSGPWLAFLLVALAFLVTGGHAKPPSEDALTAFWAQFRWHLPPLALFLVYIAAVSTAMQRLRWFEAEPTTRAVVWILVGLVFFSIAFASAVAMIRNGADGITEAYSRYENEYIGDIGFGGSLRGLFADYVSRHEFLSMHAKVHPPGPVALLWLLSFVAGREALGLSMATIAVGSLAVIPLYLWVRELLGVRVALTACFLYVLMPSVVLFTATSADILFMPFTLLTLFLFHRALSRRSLSYAVGTGLMYAVLSLLSFSLLSLGAYFGLIGILRLRERKDWIGVLQTAAVMLMSFLALQLAVRFWSGFDIVACFHASKRQFDIDQDNLQRFGPRFPSWSWKFLNPLAWLYFAGIPVSVLFFRRLAKPEPATKSLFIAIALTFVALDLLYLARGEGERSALYVFPFLLLPAAHALDSVGFSTRSLAPFGATAAFLAFQCWLTEACFYTYW